MSLADDIIRLLEKRPGQTARELAKTLRKDRRAVNIAIYGQLTDRLRKDEELRWWPESAPASSPRASTESSPPNPNEQKSTIINPKSNTKYIPKDNSHESKNVHKSSSISNKEHNVNSGNVGCLLIVAVVVGGLIFS